MKYAQAAMNQMLVYYIGIFIIIAVAIVFSFVGRKSNKTYPIGIALCLVAAWQFNLFVPFARDYIKNEVAVLEGEYENSTVGRKNTHSRHIGLKSVTLETENNRVMLTTVPGYKNTFVEGKHYVRAYYLVESKILLYIEILARSTGDSTQGTVP